jgi:DMSO reductase anchor subunit
VWKPEVPWYFFAGGTAGASSVLAAVAELSGQPVLARSARRVAAIGAAVSPVLLVADLGVPRRFLNMLRVFRPTSPLSMGSWVLSVYAPSAISAALLAEVARLPRLRRVLSGTAAVGGLPMMTYTAVLVADTAIPVWHEARRELPFLFAGSATASAGAAASLLSPASAGAPARRLTVLGIGLEVTAERAMHRRLGFLGEPYRQGVAGRYARAARSASLVGAGLTIRPGGRRFERAAGAALVLAGSVLERWAVFRAGWQSATDPQYVVRSQRARLESGGQAGG